MSMEVHVFFRGRLPSKAALGKAMKELEFPLTVGGATGSLEGHSGFMPMRLRREETGVEFDVFDGRSAVEELAAADVDPSFDRSANFRWGGDDSEMQAGLCAAAALARLTNGIVLDEADGRLFSIRVIAAPRRRLCGLSARALLVQPERVEADDA
jgi:hypothetical protein